MSGSRTLFQRTVIHFCFVIFPVCFGAWGDEREGKPKPLPQVSDFSVRDTRGNDHKKEDWKDRAAVVFFVLDRECPVSNAFAPEMNRIIESYAEKKVKFYGIYPDPNCTSEQAAAHGLEYSLNFPLIHDPEQILASATGVKIVPTALVLGSDGKILYRGRINNKWALDGSRRAEPSRHDLRDALDTVLRGESPNPNEIEPYGCLLISPVNK